MNKEEVAHLAKLSRIEVTDTELNALSHEITEILGYVSEVQEIAADHTDEKQAGVVHTVYREDTDPHEGNRYTEQLLKAAPERQGRYVKVKKILAQDE